MASFGHCYCCLLLSHLLAVCFWRVGLQPPNRCYYTPLCTYSNVGPIHLTPKKTEWSLFLSFSFSLNHWYIYQPSRPNRFVLLTFMVTLSLFFQATQYTQHHISGHVFQMWRHEPPPPPSNEPMLNSGSHSMVSYDCIGAVSLSLSLSLFHLAESIPFCWACSLVFISWGEHYHYSILLRFMLTIVDHRTIDSSTFDSIATPHSCSLFSK